VGEEDRDKQFWAEYRASWRRPEVVIATVVLLVAGTFAAVKGSVSTVAWCVILWSISVAVSQVVRRALNSRISIDERSASS
jgi:hypothetical protein